jgi:hypothetical protein
MLALPAVGGSSSITITASDPSCMWSAVVTAGGDWLSIADPASGAGNGAIAVSAVANPGRDRGGALTVAGQAVSVTQSRFRDGVGP